MRRKQIMTALLSVAMILAAMPQGAEAKDLKVKNAAEEKIMPEGSELVLKTNKKLSTLRFSSSDLSVAAVSYSGRIMAISEGNATIKVRQTGRKKAQKIKIIVKKPTGYRISRQSGRLNWAEREIKLKAARGYTVYYTTASKFKKSQKISSGKTKKFYCSKPLNLKVFAVKKGIKVTNAYLNRKKISDRNYGEYAYYWVEPCGGAWSMPSAAPASPSPNPTDEAAATATPTPAESPSMEPADLQTHSPSASLVNTSSPSAAPTKMPIPQPQGSGRL